MHAVRHRASVPVGGLLACALCCLSGCDNPDQQQISDRLAAAAGAVWFVDTSVSAGIEFAHQRADEVRYWMPEIMSGGAAWLDYDNDDDMDLYLVQGGSLVPGTADTPGNVLYRNNGDGTFTDVTAASGTGDTSYGIGAAAGDIDGDGYTDLYVTNMGANVLYRNNGNGTFDNVTASSGTGDAGWSSSAGFIDYDRDGDQDLFVVNYVVWSADAEIKCGMGQDYCHPNTYKAPAIDRLYRNDGDGQFSDATELAKISLVFGNGLGVAFGDFNNDHWPDIYVANDGMPNQLWVNQGNGTFVDEALITGAAMSLGGQAEAGMGVLAADIENDGDLDLFMTHLRGETNTLYLNSNGLFQDVTATRGLAAASLRYTGFGVAYADFDQDGLGDLYVANGRVARVQDALKPGDYFAEPNQVFRGIGQGKFVEVTPVGGTAPVQIDNSRGAAFADYDNDGDTDVVLVTNGGPARLLQNVIGDGKNWIQFHTMDEQGRLAVGAMVNILTGQGGQWRQVQPAYSYLASNDPRVHFGLGAQTRDIQVQVIWPDGRQETFGPYAANQMHTLVKGAGTKPAIPE